jgi:hypothetical protein
MKFGIGKEVVRFLSFLLVIILWTERCAGCLDRDRFCYSLKSCLKLARSFSFFL